VEDELTDKDWITLAEIYKILKPFYTLTIHLQSRAKAASRGSFWEIFPSMEYLLAHIIDEKKKVAVDPSVLEKGPDDEVIIRNRKYIRTCLNNCHGKLDTYYQLLDETPVYTASTVLNPAKRWRYFEKK